MERIRNMAKVGNYSGNSEEVKGAKGKKGKKNKESNTNKSLDSITSNICKTIFTDVESKILCCDKCELWFCTSCANVTNVGYKIFIKQRGRGCSMVLQIL